MDAYSYRREKEAPIPSFSSTLLDAIYRSIDEGEDELVLYKEAMRKKQQNSSFKNNSGSKDVEEITAVRASDYSEADSVRMPKPIRTSVSIHQEKHKSKNTKHEGGGVASKTKSRALKLYSELKKAKNQPISPGAKLASFLNTLFAPGNLKKARIEDENSERKSKSATASTCSSASSFSRSCLSKNSPSSRTRSSNNPAKRSVRFYPMSVIVDEDSKPCGQKSLYLQEKQSMEEYGEEVRSSVTQELKLYIMEKNRKVEEAARDLFRDYQKRVELEQEFGAVPHGEDDDEEEDEDDLFELDNLSVIGMERYREELPVYETTKLLV